MLATQGPGTKMSASVDTSAIFVNDNPKRIAKKVQCACGCGRGGRVGGEGRRKGGGGG